jgi:hypothetical protein
MLAFLRSDSLGTLVAGPSQITVSFTGGSGHVYALQTSPDLVHWTTLGTSSPVNGVMNVVLPAAATGAARFFRTVLVQ